LTIRIKITGGLPINGIALAKAIAMIGLAILSMEQHDHISLGNQNASAVETLDLLLAIAERQKAELPQKPKPLPQAEIIDLKQLMQELDVKHG
jgi:hypothetical protein